MTVERFPVSSETCTVLGYRVKADSLMWAGLDLSRAEPRAQSAMMQAIVGPLEAPIDLHLRAPWWHPGDGQAPDPPDMYYRVRPRMEEGRKYKGRKVNRVWFEHYANAWWIAVEFAGRARKPAAVRAKRKMAPASHEGPAGAR